MTKEQLLTTVNELHKELYQEFRKEDSNHTRSVYIAEQIEAHIEAYLQEYPDDSEIQIRFAIFLNYPPLVDTLKSMNVLRNVINYDSNNSIALLALAYIKSRCYDGVDENLRQQLAACQTNNNELKSMLVLAQSWHYMDRDNSQYELLLQNSIRLCDNYVYNYISLARLYISSNRVSVGRTLAQKGLYNVQHIYYRNDCYTSSRQELDSIEHFINEQIKGIFITKLNFKSFVDLACIQVVS